MSADLISLLQQCRSSVKTDLNHYERLAVVIRADRPAAVEKIAAVEQEADRLFALLEAIDALSAAPPTVPDDPRLYAWERGQAPLRGTISSRTVQQGALFGAELFISGLSSEAHAQRALDLLLQYVAGAEIKVN